MASVAFGLFDWVDRGEASLAQLYEERLSLVEAADAAGFVGYHLAEHHATPLGMTPSPSVFLAAVAQRTRRIRLGPLVYLLPLYSPLRLIGEICMLDQLSGGRLEVGVGRGVSPYEVGYHGLDPARTRAMFHEALAVIVAGMTSERLTHKGQFYRYDSVPMELEPFQKPYPPLWYATSNLESVEWAASQGMNLAGLGPAETYRKFVDAYRAAWPRHRHDAGRLNAHVATPRIAINRQVVMAETDAEAEEIVRAGHPRWAESFLKLWTEHGDTTYQQRVNLDAALSSETILCGSPARVRGQVARLIETTGVDYVICAFAWGNLTFDQSFRSLRLFTDEVMPSFS
ncbi:MAG: LLM class flavin-dependent oxidoreductase [Candidatus Rokuibacteriota bacterium]|nr:MAG: LLM class flavin-dependent oxidoreductase [Candidatus Rokubacteria bacterium]